MTNVFIVPKWFFGYDIILELVFALITLFVAIYGFKLYKLCREKQFKYFGLAFSFIALSYFLQSLINFFLLYDLNSKIRSLMHASYIYDLAVIEIFIHIFFFVLGFLLLTYNTFKIDNLRVFYLLFVVVIISIFFSLNKIFMFYLLASVLLFYLVIHYAITYWYNRKPNALIMSIALLLILFSTLHFILAMNQGIYYVIGHIFELIAYLFIAGNLYMIVKNGKDVCTVSNHGKKKR
ncbi:MAG: hypothetical protein WC916_05055 [Candidatus Woesearchaeota archaeon]